MLNPRSPIPLYRQLADELTAKISQGHYPPGSRIPSEQQLAAAHRIGRPTVRQAIEALVLKGLLIRRRGSGTYVREPQREVDLFSLDGTGASFQKKGVMVHSRVVIPIRLQTVDAPDAHPMQGRTAFFLSRLTLADHTPVLLENIFLDAELFPHLDRFDLQDRSLSAIAEEHYYLRPHQGKQSFTIDLACDENAGLLQVAPRTPLLVVRRHLHFPQIKNGVFAELWCRTDQFVFSQRIGENSNE